MKTTSGKVLTMAPGPWGVTPAGGIGFSGSAGFNLEPWGNESPIPQEILRLIAAAPTLAVRLGEVVEAFRLHLLNEAERTGVKPEDLCPCWSNELTAAMKALSEAGVR